MKRLVLAVTILMAGLLATACEDFSNPQPVKDPVKDAGAESSFRCMWTGDCQ